MWKPPVRHKVTRQELYDLLWSEPVYKAAQRYAISGVGLAKICRNASIPLPPRGYWAQLQHGKKPRRTLLKPAPGGKSETLVITQGSGPRPPRPPEPELDPSIVKAIEAERLDKNRISVPDNVSHLHPETKKLADAADRARPWNERNAKVEPLERRRRRILHAFFRALEQRGADVTVLPYHAGFDVELLGSTFHMSCSEPIRRKRVPMTKAELKARSEWNHRDYNTVDERAGILRMRMARGDGHPKDFLDTEDAPLETRLNDIMIWLLQHSITVAERDRRAEAARVAAAEAEQRRWEEQQRRWEAEERRRREEKRVAELVDEANRWRRATEIRAYIAASSESNRAEETWKVWALRVADEMDPLTVAGHTRSHDPMS